MLARPRFAWEVAYVGTLVLVLLCGTSYSPFREVPPRALAVVQIDPAVAYRAASGRLVEARAQVTSAGSRAWRSASDPLEARIDAAKSRFAAEHPDMADGLSSLGRDGAELIRAATHGDFLRSSLLVNQVGGDLKRIWQALQSGGAARGAPRT